MQWPYVTGDHSKFEEKQNGIFGLTPSIFPESQVTVNPRIFGPRVLETRAAEKMKEIGNALMLKQLPSYIPLQSFSWFLIDLTRSTTDSIPRCFKLARRLTKMKRIVFQWSKLLQLF